MADLIVLETLHLLVQSPGTRPTGPSCCTVSGHVALASTPVTGDACPGIHLKWNFEVAAWLQPYLQPYLF